MDFDGSSGDIINNNETCGSDMWEWQETDCCLQKDSQLDITQCMWDGNGQKDDSLMYTMGNQTPIQHCGEFALDILDVGDEAMKGLEEENASRVKRRRVLQFTSDSFGSTAGNEQISPAATNSKEDSIVDVWPENLQWNPVSSDDRFLFSNEILDQSSDEWLESLDDYLNDSQMSSSTNDQVIHRSSSTNDQVIHTDQVEVSDFSNRETDTRADVIPNPPKSATLKIFRGRRSYIDSSTKLTTSVAYPFTLFKECEVQGHSTLKDINQRIHAPPPRSSRHKMDDGASIDYPTSAFSGKPVVVKTKILTEGGKGSITILRTKG